MLTARGKRATREQASAGFMWSHSPSDAKMAKRSEGSRAWLVMLGSADSTPCFSPLGSRKRCIRGGLWNSLSLR